MYCPFCGSEVSERAKFCVSCGKALKKGEIYISDPLSRFIDCLFAFLLILGGILPYLLEYDSVDLIDYFGASPGVTASFSSITYVLSFLSSFFYFSTSFISVYTGLLLLKKKSGVASQVILCAATHTALVVFVRLKYFLITTFPKMILSIFTNDGEIISRSEEMIRYDFDAFRNYHEEANARVIISLVLVVVSLVFLFLKRQSGYADKRVRNISALGGNLMIFSLSVLSILGPKLSQVRIGAFGHNGIMSYAISKNAFHSTSNDIRLALILIVVTVAVLLNAKEMRWITPSILGLIFVFCISGYLLSPVVLQARNTPVEYYGQSASILRMLFISSSLILIAIYFWFKSLSENRLHKSIQIAMPILLPVLYVVGENLSLFCSLGLGIEVVGVFAVGVISTVTVIVSLLSRNKKNVNSESEL